MPMVRIPDKSMKRLEAWAEPFEDTVESALARALDAAERHRAAAGRASKPGPVAAPSPWREGAVERRRVESPEDFVEHLLAMPDVGDDSDFEGPRSGPRPVAM